MKIIIVIAACLIVLGTGFWIMKQVDIFIENNNRTMYQRIETNELIIGIDMPSLAENFISKIYKEIDAKDDFELRVCMADAEALGGLLEEQKIDCALIESDTFRWIDAKMQCGTMTLIPQHLHMNCSHTLVEPIDYQERTVRVVWYPEKETGNKKHLNDILVKLVDDKS